MLGIFKFGLMVRCATKRHPFSYTFYGCWCGIGGGGKIVDETDRYITGQNLHFVEQKLYWLGGSMFIT